MDPLFATALIVIFILAFTYEVWRAIDHRPTISEQIWVFCVKWPPILFLAGVLCGHLFTH